ncbi:hypothetical protein L6164_000938 [Bauhinia variegata]|uniref:Uncharacterized protein n=1 Tax=Bauhinia variegata TaxID=167791 RepID=A0ACB9Q879_BAUVA|nr:hypothetical protein L6164_000938 [Bauhinia variegata]
MSAVRVIVFVSLGCIIFFCLLAFAVCRFIKKRKKTTIETDVVHIDEEKHVKGSMVSGPFGKPSVVISMEGEKHVNEDIIKREKLAHAHAPSANPTTARTNQ